MQKTLSGKNILITGGAGFIGSNLIEYFLNQGNKVTCLDNLSTGNMDNIREFEKNPNFRFMLGDIRDYRICCEACQNKDIIFHQAALGSVPRSINDPITTNEVNISGFVNMISAAKEQEVERFIYAASSSTYGDNEKLPKVEENIGKPLSPYAITKYVNELYADVFSRLYGIKCIGLRYFNVFGKRQTPDGAYAAVIPKFIKKLIQHEAPVIHGDGSQSRDFTYINNVIQANELAALTENSEAFNQVYNVACGENISLLELTKEIIQQLSRFDSKILEINPEFGEERIGDIKHSLASIEKIKTRLGYKPTYNVHQGIDEAITWYYNHLK
jgi:UDP-N-acetylglucosamine/UDP-N-acetylgalactosamine 4-epimerase